MQLGLYIYCVYVLTVFLAHTRVTLFERTLRFGNCASRTHPLWVTYGSRGWLSSTKQVFPVPFDVQGSNQARERRREVVREHTEVTASIIEFLKFICEKLSISLVVFRITSDIQYRVCTISLVWAVRVFPSILSDPLTYREKYVRPSNVLIPAQFTVRPSSGMRLPL